MSIDCTYIIFSLAMIQLKYSKYSRMAVNRGEFPELGEVESNHARAIGRSWLKKLRLHRENTQTHNYDINWDRTWVSRRLGTRPTPKPLEMMHLSRKPFFGPLILIDLLTWFTWICEPPGSLREMQEMLRWRLELHIVSREVNPFFECWPLLGLLRSSQPSDQKSLRQRIAFTACAPDRDSICPTIMSGALKVSVLNPTLEDDPIWRLFFRSETTT